MNKEENTASSSLVRGISQWDFVSLIINITIGAGILGLPAKVFALMGAYSIWAFIGCAFLILALILCFAEVGSRFRGTGGPYLYTLTTLGPLPGFMAGWLLWLSRLFSFASVCNLLLDYAAILWPQAGQGTWRTVITLFVIITLALVNYRGIRTATVINNMITLCKLSVLISFVAIGFFFLKPGLNAELKPLSIPSFGSAILLLIFAFSGFDVAAVPAGEVKNPSRTVPFGLLVALAMVTLLYTGIQYVCMGTLPNLGQSARPIAEAASRFMGTKGSYIVTAGALVTMLGTLNVLMLTSSRLLMALAEQGQLFTSLKKIDRRYHTPSVALMVSAVVIALLTTSGSFIYALTISAIIRLFTFVTTCLALLLLRKQGLEPAPFKVKFGPWVAGFAIALCLLLLVNISKQEALHSLLAALSGLVVYMAYQFFSRRRLHLL